MRWLALSFLVFFCSVANAADELSIKQAWVRVPAPGSTLTAAYLTIESSQALTLYKVTSPAAAAVEMHTMTMKGDVMEMRQVDAIEVKPGQATRLERGGLHLMLFDLKKPLKAGDQVDLVLHFKQAGKPTISKGIKVPVKVTQN
jgi:periplasmic copper chaperone A